MDTDLHGPSIPAMLGVSDARVGREGTRIRPVVVPSLNNLRVLSVGFLLPNRDDAVIWRGAMKAGAINQFVNDVAWGDLDYLVVDCPPGTGDELLSIVHELDGPEGAILVTTPQEVAAMDVRKSINFCDQMGVPVLGIVENMSGFHCSACGHDTDIFASGAGEAMAAHYQIPFLGKIPLDPAISRSGEDGQPFVLVHAKSANSKVFVTLFDLLEARFGTSTDESSASLKIAVPVVGGLLDQHFGHCSEVQVFTVEVRTGYFSPPETIIPPQHEPNLLPRWFADRGIDLVIAGGMGSKAREMFEERGIEVLTGAPSLEPSELVRRHLEDTLVTGRK